MSLLFVFSSWNFSRFRYILILTNSILLHSSRSYYMYITSRSQQTSKTGNIDGPFYCTFFYMLWHSTVFLLGFINFHSRGFCSFREHSLYFVFSSCLQNRFVSGFRKAGHFRYRFIHVRDNSTLRQLENNACCGLLGLLSLLLKAGVLWEDILNPFLGRLLQ